MDILERENYLNASGDMGSWLDKLIGEEGVKTDVSVKLSNSEYLKLGATIVTSLIIGVAIGNLISGR